MSYVTYPEPMGVLEKFEQFRKYWKILIFLENFGLHIISKVGGKL